MANYTNIAQTLVNGMLKGTKTPITSPSSARQINEIVKSFLPGVRMNAGITNDTVQLSMKKFLVPTETEVKTLLQKHEISANSFCKGKVLLSKPFVNTNNEIFLKRLDELYPAANEENSATVNYLMCCLENINHSGFKDKEAFLQQFIKEWQSVKGMTNKNGELLFPRKMSLENLYSMKSILQAKYNSPDRYNNITDLYKLVKQGKAPDYILKGLIPEGDFHSLAKGDINALTKGKNYFEQFSNENSSEILNKTKLGDAFSINNKMYIRTADSYEELRLSKSMYERLFPPIERYALAQTENSCHFVATLDGMIKNPETRVNLYKMFEQTGKNSVRIKLHKQSTVPIDFDLRNTDYLNVTEGANGYLKGALGHRMIEHTVGVNFNLECNEPTKNALFHINNGGNPEVFDMPYLLGRNANKVLHANGTSKRALLDKSTGNILTVLRAENAKATENHLPDIVNRNIGFTGGHVYSSQQGKLSNPWNTIEMLPYPEVECSVPYAVYV